MTNDEEKVILQKHFKGNNESLQLVQACMLGLELTKEESDILRSIFSDDALCTVFERRFLPRLSKEHGIGQQGDEWAGLEVDVYGSHPDKIFQATRYKKGAIALTRTALNLLKNPDADGIDLSYDPDLAVDDPLAVRLLTRNMYIKHVQTVLSIMWIIAESKDAETPQQTAKRLQQDSTQ